MGTDRIINVGMIGCGYAARLIHAPLLAARADRFRLVACADAVPASAAKFGAEFGVRAFESVSALIADKEVDLVIIATKPPTTHRDISLEAFGAGKHVVVEKPMAQDEGECTQMVEAAKKAGRILAVHHNRRWDLDFLAAREAIASGTLGDLRIVRNEYTAGFVDSPYDWGIHIIDQTMALSLGRKFTHLSAVIAKPDPANPTASEGFFAAHLITEDGVAHDMSMLPTFGGNAYRPGRMVNRFVLIGTQGALFQDWCQRPEDALARPFVFQGAQPGKGYGEPSFVEAKLTIPGFYDLLHTSIADGGPVPVSGEEGRRAVKAWHLVCEAACSGKVLSVSL